MRHVVRTALVPYSAEQMFILVDDVEAYPRFLPWCSAAEEHSRAGNIVEATIELRRHGMRRRFRTRNRLTPHEAIEISLIQGPFRQLEGHWHFQQLADLGSKVRLEMHFEFSSGVVAKAFGPIFEETCNSLVAAFTTRASEVYGDVAPRDE